jgi:hypothetical protein
MGGKAQPEKGDCPHNAERPDRPSSPVGALSLIIFGAGPSQAAPGPQGALRSRSRPPLCADGYADLSPDCAAVPLFAAAGPDGEPATSNRMRSG